MLKNIAQKLRAAETVILSTHRQCDGDGLGAEIALFHALKKTGKKVHIFHVDPPAPKYAFLGTDQWVKIFSAESTALPTADLALIFDTNDHRLVEPLFSALSQVCRQTLFVDHHPPLSSGPLPTPESVIDTSAASTGEVVFQLIKELGIELDAQIARGLYTSVVFDTQLFRYVKSSSASHLMAAELLKFESAPEDVHRHLFATYTVEKLNFLMKALLKTEYRAENRLAFVPVLTSDFEAGAFANKARHETGDIIDQLMNIESIEMAALLRQDSPSSFKLSLRGRGTFEVLSIAESFGGGGHRFASGAYLQGTYEELRGHIIAAMENGLSKDSDAKKKQAQ